MGRISATLQLALIAMLVVTASQAEPTDCSAQPGMLFAASSGNSQSGGSQTVRCPEPTQTQPSWKRPSGNSWLRRAIDDQKQIYVAPFRRANIKWDLLFLAGTGGLIAADPHISRHVPPGGVDVSRDISDVGLYSTMAAVGGVWIFGIKNDNAQAREAGVLGLESLANTGAVLALMQLTAGRQRPTEGDGYGRFWRNNALDSSFPSAHSSFTWAAASVLASEYPRAWVRWLAYGTAIAVSVTRVTGLKHFPADVAVGGALGYLIGRQVFHSHCSPGLSPNCRRKGNLD